MRIRTLTGLGARGYGDPRLMESFSAAAIGSRDTVPRKKVSALSSGEAELYGMVKGVSHALGIRSLLPAYG